MPIALALSASLLLAACTKTGRFDTRMPTVASVTNQTLFVDVSYDRHVRGGTHWGLEHMLVEKIREAGCSSALRGLGCGQRRPRALLSRTRIRRMFVRLPTSRLCPSLGTVLAGGIALSAIPGFAEEQGLLQDNPIEALIDMSGCALAATRRTLAVVRQQGLGVLALSFSNRTV